MNNGFPRVIGFTGRSGAGKTTAAKLLADYLAEYKDVMILPITSAVKEQARALGWNGVKDEKGRRLLQVLGTEIGRECLGEDHWIRQWEQRVRDIQALFYRCDHLLFIADDVRFVNEAAAIRALSGVIIRMKRECLGDLPPAIRDHPSEHASDHVSADFVIENFGNLEQLGCALRDVITLIIKERGLT